MKKGLYIFLFLSTQFLIAQQPVFIHLTEKDGVPDNEFYDVIEDNEGYIWFAADKGLYRFDGVNYKKFQHPIQRGLSVFSLNKDETGTIWFVNISGQVFYIENEQVVLFGDYKEDFKGELPTLKVLNNLVVLYMPTKILIINKNTQNEIFNRTFKRKPALIEPTVLNGFLYYGTDFNVVQLDLEDFTSEEKIPFSSSYNRYIQRSFFSVLKRETLIYFTRDKIEGVKFFKFQKGIDNKIETLEHHIPNIKIIKAQSINNQIWYCTENGVYVCEISGNKLILKQHLFPNQFITNVILDKHANYWFTTLNNALYVVPNIAIKNLDVKLGNDKIKAVSPGKSNELLITTINYKLHNYNVDSNKQQTYNFLGKPDIHFVSFNPFTNKYNAFTNLGDYLFNENLKEENIFPGGGTIKDIQNVSKDTALIAFRGSVQSLKRFLEKDQEDLYKKNARGYAVHYNAKSKHSYFATIDGLFVLDENHKEQEITYKGETIYINKIEQTIDGTLWCSSFKNGLYAIKNNEIITHFTTDNSLLSNSNSYIKAKDNILWIAGEKGVQCLNIETGVFQNLTKREGIVSYNYNGLEIIKDNVYISSPEQLIYFNKDEVFKSYNTPKVYFTNVLIANVKQSIKQSYTLKEKASSVAIHFNAIGYKTSTSGKFEYRLIGLDSSWTKSSSGVSNVQYNTLLEGNYTFQIRNVSDNKTEVATKEIKLIVTKPVWEKLWFYVLLSLFVVAIVVLFYRQQNRKRDAEKNKLLKQLETKSELINLKLENLRSQMNPHFVFNALNSIQDYIISNQKDLAGDFLGKFADLIRLYLEQSNEKEILLSVEIDTIKRYLELEKLRFEDKLEYDISIDDNLDPETIIIPTMLLQPFVENALKHGLLHKKTVGHLKINFSLNPSQTFLLIDVIDDGVGRNKAKEIKSRQFKKHNSFATQATQDRLALLNFNKEQKTEIRIEDLIKNSINGQTGTKVSIKTPLRFELSN